MKKLFLMFLLVFGLIGCDNNEGPMTIVNQGGVSHLYFNDKPAEGICSVGVTYGQVQTPLFESEFEDGLPEGKFVLYDGNGIIRIKGDGKWNKLHTTYKGKITEYDHRGLIQTVNKGLFKLNPSDIVYHDGTSGLYGWHALLLDGEAYNIIKGEDLTFYTIHDDVTEYRKYYDNGEFSSITTYDKKNKIREYQMFDENGDHTYHSITNEKEHTSKILVNKQ